MNRFELTTRLVLLAFCIFISNGFPGQEDIIPAQTYYYASGTIKSTVISLANNRTRITNYYESGTKQSEIDYRGKKKHGPGIFYNPDGSVKAKEMNVNGRSDGNHEWYSDSGRLEATGTLKKNKKVGTWIWYHPNGNKSIIQYYKNDKQDSLSNSYYETGSLKSTAYYKKGKPEGVAESYYEHGKKEWTGNYKNGLQDGKQIYYYKEGMIAREITYEKNKRNGPLIAYYKNSKIKYSGDYKDGRMYGERLYYTIDGNMINSQYTLFNEDGSKDREFSCINGKPEGTMSVYNKGQLVILANFKDGKPEGFTYYYNDNSDLKATEIYKNGIFVKEVKGAAN